MPVEAYIQGLETLAEKGGVLKAAQALADAHALQDAGRRVIRFRVNGEVSSTIKALTANL